ncbi:hypothetical protein [Epilithonimonas mollis]|uniref:Uncharacterized protein n=1 Tax=Epilithonimonas mollis TaxID=216903 RepID=A0A1M6TVN6_9FLAO|nr:hypothetical protein [Epilithonimonas mollis]SHK60868.1 hypothetical protein SAMN05444371_2963 [Epilithonimonas mollis]
MTKEGIKTIINLLNESLSENIKKRHLFFERAEQIVLWIVGFSLAAIVLLITNGKSEIDKIQGTEALRVMVIKNFLLICCFGLSFRILSFVTELILENISKSLYGLLKGFHSSLNLEKNKFNNNEDSEEIIKIINKDFDWNLTYNEQLRNDPNFIKLLKEIYENEFENKEYLDKIQELFLLFYGYKSKKI